MSAKVKDTQALVHTFLPFQNLYEQKEVVDFKLLTKLTWTLNIYGFRFGALLELLGWFFWEYESLVKKVSLSIYLILASETLKDDERASYVVSTLIL